MSYSRSKKNTRKLLRTIILLWVLACIVIIAITAKNPKRISSLPTEIIKQNTEQQTPTIPQTFEPPEGSIFIPYWKVSSLSEPLLPETIPHKSLRHLIYFGVAPKADGALDQSEPGYTNLARFAEKVTNLPGSKLLTLRMMNEDISEAILSNTTYQDNLINELISLSQQYSFDGVLVDLEHSVLPTQDTVQNISAFLERAATATHAQRLSFSITIYGDTFYRQRPYDVKKIASFSDEIMIMAYDFHKSYGEPGPNFPLSKGESFAYDFTSMVDDFIEVVPAEKITVLFGLFGYDWSVDDQNRPAKAAKALTLGNIESSLIPKCPSLRCEKSRDSSASESTITYVEEGGQKHTVWYEDSLSIKAKASFLSTKNIPSIGYWAFGYY